MSLEPGKPWISHTAYQERNPSRFRPEGNPYAKPCDGSLIVEGFERGPGFARCECDGCGFEVYVKVGEEGAGERHVQDEIPL
jgi:hypothetical protein